MLTGGGARGLKPEGRAPGKFIANISLFFFQKGGLYLIFWWVSCLTKGDVTRDDSQKRLVAQHSIAISLRHCF